MTCQEVIEFLMDYLGGSLPEADRVRFAKHLGVCPSCVAYLNTYEETVRLGQKCLCALDSPLQPVPEELVQAILAARAKKA